MLPLTAIVKASVWGGADINAWLLEAAVHGYTAVVRALVSAGAEVNFKRNDGSSPLIAACQEGHFDCVKLLVQSGAEVYARTNKGATPLYLAASKGHTEVVQFLIEQHADVNACLSGGESCLWAAAFDGHTAVVCALVSAGADVNLKDNDQFSPLSMASQQGHTDCVELLVHSGAEVDTRNNQGATPLYLAAAQGHIEVVQFLIEQHADVNARCNDGESCLWRAASNGHTDVVHALVRVGADVNLHRNDGFSPLGAVSHRGHTDCVKLLAQSGADVDARNVKDATPLYFAAQNGHIEVVQILIEQHADVNACCNDGASCLQVAAFYGHTAVVCALLFAGADVNIQDNDQFSPLSMASQQGHTDCVELLVQSGAELEARNNKGATPLNLAAIRGHTEVVQFLTEQDADVNACCAVGQSCLLAAAFKGHTAVVRALVSAGADVNLQRNDGASPLILAVQNRHTDIVVMLLDSGADTEIRDSDGRTALWFALERGRTALLDILIAHGADVDAADYRLQTPLCEAAMDGDIHIVNRLIQRKANITREEDALSYVAASVKRVSKAMLQLLLNVPVECRADIYARNVDNLQAVDIASYCGHIDILRLLYSRLTCTNSFNTGTLNQLHYHSISASCLSSGTHTDCNCNTPVDLTTDVQCVRSWLENGADVEAENVDGLRPIHCAVRTGLVELAELLIQHGANVDAADVYGNRPLHEAVSHGLNIVQLLVHHGAKMNVQNVDGKTPLHVAIERQHSEVVTFLLNAGADTGLTDVRRNTPLHYLTVGQPQYGERGECAVKQSKDYQHLLIRNAVGMTALSSMAACGILDCANHKREISSANRVASQEDVRSEQLPHAFSSSVIPCLLELHHVRTFSETKELALTDCYGNTPLHYAVGVYTHLKLYRVSADVKKTVEFLMKRGADINAQNKDGLTPLHVARGKEATEACLQHADDQSFTITDKRGRNFWHLSFFLGNVNNATLATKKRPRISASDAMRSSDDLNRTPLHYACMKVNVRTAEWQWMPEELIQKYNDEHVNQQDRFGRTALHYAAMAGNSVLMDFLKTKKASGTVRDSFEKTAGEYSDIHGAYKKSIFLLQLVDTSSSVARNFHSVSLCIQQYFSHGNPNVKSSKVELRKIVCNMRGDNVTSYVLNTYNGCRFDYSDVFRRKPEELPDNVNKSAKQPPTMFAAIHSQMEKAMQHLAKEISDKDGRFACEVVLVGSAREGIRIGSCDEFDYNFVLTDVSRRCKVGHSPESPPGFVLLKASTPEYDKDLFDSSGILNTRIVKFQFETLVKQILSSLSFCEATGLEFIYPVANSSISPETTSTKVNMQVTLKFTIPVNGYYVPHSISVDIVPALRIDGWWPDDTRRKDLCQPGDCLIVFTQPQLKYPWIGWTEPHGFISFAGAESRLLRDSPPVIKAACMVVKRMSSYFCQHALFSSHVIKTALFWCLDEAPPSSECSSSNYNAEVDGDELVRWVRNILRRMLRFAAQDYVPTYFMPQLHQPVWLKERYLKQFHMRLYQHGVLTYADLFSLNEQQCRDHWLKFIKSLFILSHLMYWTVLSDDDELELFVPSTINPLMENDVCANSIESGKQPCIQTVIRIAAKI